VCECLCSYECKCTDTPAQKFSTFFFVTDLLYQSQAIRDDSEASPPLCLDIDTLTFDRVLIFLESAASGGQDPPMWSLHLIDDLAKVRVSLSD